ncbi:MAG: hypothetical protein DRO67_00375 [Candidatus Asgardarchaeum californiense]|nr:MAG: hypothetical protein DRO67_00375 [Candidatus Asgardarchaeum californiense]
MNKEVVRASLRLFNAVQIKEDAIKDEKINDTLLERTVPNGYILNPYIFATTELLNIIEDVVGISGEKANSSFHKSWAVVRDSSMEELVMHQIVHYITTYGFEALGIYNESTVYIPNEKLELPELRDGGIPLTVIKAFTGNDMITSIIKLGSSGIALHEEILDDIMTIIEHNKWDSKYFINDIQNRELKTRLLDFYGVVPSEPVEFLRHVISKLTDESLLIKNFALIEKIKASNGKFCDELMKQAPPDLASIFLRYKPIFLALRSISKNKGVFNKLRRQAVTMHKPLPEDYLNNVTGRLKEGTLDIKKLQDKLEKAPIFRKIRLAYALRHRMEVQSTSESIVYQVRNGKGWSTTFNWGVPKQKTDEVFRAVMSSIMLDISKNVKDKIIYIPEGVYYSIPATEKQFTGNIPSGSYVSVPEDLVVGVQWKNQNGYRVDLDLASISVEGKIGWDSSYRSVSHNVLFSGDVTDARGRNGASELFYFSGSKPYSPMLITLNYYNFDSDVPVPTKLFAASERISNMKRNYMVDVNNIVFSSLITVNKKQNFLGLYMHNEGENRFYFYHTSIGGGISSRYDSNTIRTREFLETKMASPIILNEVLESAGAIVITDKKEILEDNYIDLSPENIDKNSFIDILVGEM